MLRSALSIHVSSNFIFSGEDNSVSYIKKKLQRIRESNNYFYEMKLAQAFK
jgi:hypothetical protein